LGFDPLALQHNINHLFTTYDITPQQIIITSSFGLDLLPSHPDLGTTETGMMPSQIGILRDRMASLEDQYDYMVIDTPHSEGYLPVVAFVMANDVVVSLQTHFLAYQKLPKVLNQIDQVKHGLNPGIRIDGILPVMVHPRNNMDKAILDRARNDYPNLLYPMQVPYSTKHSEASVAGLPIVLYEPTHPGASAYLKLAERFM
jgi:chromosome partitioning protein